MRVNSVNGRSSHADALTEYDPAVNQMPMQYEHDTKDRDSEHYRQLPDVEFELTEPLSASIPQPKE